jgi:phosphoglycerate kinase
MNIRTFKDFKALVSKKKTSLQNVVIRCDLNLPSNIEDLSRIYAIKDTVLAIIELGLKVILVSHYKRPRVKDRCMEEFSLHNITTKIANVVGVSVAFINQSVFDLGRASITSDITLLENLRFYDGEEANNYDFAQAIASLGDVYINEAFSVSHRAHASVAAITKLLPSFAGISFEKELLGLAQIKNRVQKPYTAIIGGSKISSKIDVLRAISQEADYLIITGAMANTFLAANGHNLGASFVETDCFSTACDIQKHSKAQIILPSDLVVSHNINEFGTPRSIDSINCDCAGFDIGPQTVENIKRVIAASKTLLWNGALGAFEFANFDASSKTIASLIAQRTDTKDLVSVVGGGETVASIGVFKDSMSFVSTAGGAFLEYIANHELPGISALKNSSY